VGDELFALLDPADADKKVAQVAVYSINGHQLLRHLKVSGYKPDYNSDMTSCVQNAYLYMSDCGNSCIHRYNLSNSFSFFRSPIHKLSVPDRPWSLSVTPSGNLLVTCRGEPSKLVELSAYSCRPERGVTLQSDIVNPWHSVQLPSGKFVVCHGFHVSDLHRVCVVGDDGKVEHSYGGPIGSGIGQLYCPSHLAVDKDAQFIFVADQWNHRVVLLSPTLEFVCYIGERLYDPRRLYFHQATRRLFVGQWRGDVSVIKL